MPDAETFLGEARPASDGLVEPGNINLTNRPRVKNPDGSISTVRSIGVNINGQEVLIPTVSDDGKILSDDDAVSLYRRTGKHLGKFSDAASSDAYAKQLHEDQAKLIQPSEPSPDLAIPDPLEMKKQRLEASQARTQPKRYAETFIDENKNADVPLDVESGAPFWQRVRGSFRSQPDQQVKFWQDLYGSGNVRPAIFQGRPTGGLIIRALDEKTQKPKDILVDEEHFSAKDLGDMAGSVPELVAGAASILATKRALPMAGRGGFIKSLRDVGAMGVGSETVGALKDLTTKTLDQMPVEAMQVIEEHAKAVPRDVFWGGILGILGKGLSKVITPFGDAVPEVSREGMQAADYLKARFGEEVPYSTGEKTGQSIIQRTEQEMKRLPGGAGAYSDLRVQQQSVFQRIMDRLKGLPSGASASERAALPSEEEIGEQAMIEMQQHNQTFDQAIKNAREKLTARSQERISNAIAAQTAANPMRTEMIGAQVRNRVMGERDAFLAKDRELYEKAKALPGGRDRILIAPNVAKRAENYLAKELPAKDVVTEVPTGVVNASGEMITRTETGRVPMREFIPSNVIGKLNELASTGQTKWSLQDLIAMRNEVSNDIATGEAIPGVQTHHLRKIRDMLTEGIQDSTGAIQDQKLKTAWQEANNFHADNIERFQTKLISSLLKKPTESGYIGSHEIVDRVLNKTDNILEAKKFLGGRSPEYGNLKRGLADRLFNSSLIAGTGTLDGKSFVRGLSDLRSNNPTVFNEVFGTAGNDALLQADNMRLGQLAKLDADTISKAFLAGPRPNLRALVSAEQAKDLAYKNQVREWIGSKSIPGTLKPAEFVDRFVSGASPKEAKEVMDLLGSNPGLQQRVRAKVVENLLGQAARNPTEGDLVALRLDPSRVINSEKLINLLGDAEKQRVYMQLLGPQTFKDLQQLARAIRPIEQKQAAYAGAGGIAGGMEVSGFLRGGIVPFLWNATRHKIIASMLTMRPTRQWLENTKLTGNAKDNFVAAAIASEPFWDSLVEDYGRPSAQKVMRQLGQQIGIDKKAQPQGPGARQDAEQFLQH